MPLRPKFSIHQDESSVTISVHVPYVRVGDAEIVVDGPDVSLWCQPYLLKLVFPHELRDEEHAVATYDPNVEHGTLTIQLIKAVPGTVFPDLDLPGRLLAPEPDFPNHPSAHLLPGYTEGGVEEGLEEEESGAAGSGLSLTSRMLSLNLHDRKQEDFAGDLGAGVVPPRRPLIEVMTSQDSAVTGGSSEEEASAAGGEAVDTAQEYGYGFNRGHRRLFSTLREEVASVVQLPDPENVRAVERSRLRVAHEDMVFDAGRYAGDWMGGIDDPVYQAAVCLRPWWAELGGGEWVWLQAEEEALASIKVREMLVDGRVAGRGSGPTECDASAPAPERTRLLAALAGMMFSYSYDYRTTGGDPSVESGWTTATLSPALSWLDDELLVPSSPEGPSSPSLPVHLYSACAAACMRRSLVFPYLRMWNLGMLCLQDAALLMSLGRRPCLRALCSLRHVFAHDTDDKSGAPRYLLNMLWVDEMIGWLQAAGPGAVTEEGLGAAGAAFAEAISRLSKEGPDFAEWSLLELEKRAAEVPLEEEDSEGEGRRKVEGSCSSEGEGE